MKFVKFSAAFTSVHHNNNATKFQHRTHPEIFFVGMLIISELPRDVVVARKVWEHHPKN